MQCRRTGIARIIFGIVAALMMSFALPRAAATEGYYINNNILEYPGTIDYPPQIDASNFVNNSYFIINFQTYSGVTQPFYETWDTINYTNIGVMLCDAGFRIDTQSSATQLRTAAGTFYSPGEVDCSASSNSLSTILGSTTITGYGQCLVTATNIIIPGQVNVYGSGLIQLTGQNVILDQGVLNLEGGGANSGGSSEQNLNTNTWIPSEYLGANFADSAPVKMLQQSGLYLVDSVCYLNQEIETTGTNTSGTNIVRAVFIEDTSPGVTVSVYFGTPGNGLGGGDVTIEWAGSYYDPASGNSYSNYLYLNNDYLEGISTNILPLTAGGTPASMVFTESTAPINFSPIQATAPGFLNIFNPNSTITNTYLYTSQQLLASPSTNAIPNYSVTNLAGRVQISADNYLSLSNAEIDGASYISLQAARGFAGSGGATIQTPYADLNLGKTNGILILSNTIAATIPAWGGTIQAWNTEWTYTGNDATTGNPVTNDYRVLIIGSKLTTTIAAQVQNLILHDYASNNIIISDAFNIMKSFSADAQSITLTTNPPGNGATSLEGELDFEPVGISWQSAVPNLRFLTNNGAIRLQNLVYSGNPLLTNYLSISAMGTLKEAGTNAVRKDKVAVGANQYMFVARLTNSVANQVAIVSNSFDATMNNLIAAINGGGAGGPGVAFSSATTPNPAASAGPLLNGAFTVAATASGAGGNGAATTFTPATSSVNLSWNGHAALYGGASSTNVVSYLNNTAFINNGVFQDLGSVIYAGNFVNSGEFDNELNSFTLNSLTATLAGGSLTVGQDVTITADSLVASGQSLVVPRSLTLTITNQLTDGGPFDYSVWSVGTAAVNSGINLPIKPAAGDLLGTTITLTAPASHTVYNVWAGEDRGLSAAGYTNNVAIGHMIFDVGSTSAANHNGVLVFNGAGVSNAIYVDLLELTDFATHGNSTNNYNFPWLNIGTNMVIYYAQAMANGQSVAEAIDDQSRLGANNGRLRWVYSYAGQNSSTNIEYVNPDGTLGMYTVNTALAQSAHIDSDSDGIPNLNDSTLFFQQSAIHFSASATNLPPESIRVQWSTIPNATNYVYYTTNITSDNWLPFTNYSKWYFGNNVAVPHLAVNWFVSPQVYVNNPSLPDNSQNTNVWLYEAVTNAPHYFKVLVSPVVDFQP